MKEFSGQQKNPSEDVPYGIFSFWKPDPLPPKNSMISPVKLLSLGKLNDVAERICEVPNMAKLPESPWNQEGSTELTLQWQVENGVILHVKTEQGPPKPGEVITIRATSHAPNKTFYRLYVQLFEQFGVTVLDESIHDFVTPKEFRSHLAG